MGGPGNLQIPRALGVWVDAIENLEIDPESLTTYQIRSKVYSASNTIPN